MAIRGKGYLRTELSAIAPLAVTPDHLEVLEACRIRAQRQLGSCKSEARTARLARFRIGEVNEVILGVVRGEKDTQLAALSLVKNGRHIRDGRLGSLLSDQLHTADLLGDQHTPVGQEGNPPGQLEGRYLDHVERQTRLGLLPACIDLCIYPSRRKGQKEPRDQ